MTDSELQEAVIAMAKESGLLDIVDSKYYIKEPLWLSQAIKFAELCFAKQRELDAWSRYH